MRNIFIVFLLFFTLESICQNNKVLLTINNEEITVSEFSRVYEKNRSIIDDNESQSPKEYLDLFVNYKLKVQEAISLGYEENANYKKEFKKYRDQLAKKFITETKVTDKLVKEAYSRLKTEINARHILIRLAEGNDTIQAYQKIINARKRIVNGENFAVVAKEVSEDPSAQKNGGELGWFKAFNMVYPFENAAYKTELNDVSKPFKTQFGYHIVQPTAVRKAEGSITIAHIVIAHKQIDTLIIAKNKINDIYASLQKGETFESLAKEHSDDRNSSLKGGRLTSIERGQIRSKVFEEQAFGLKEISNISAPFETEIGWHIIKLLEKNPVPSFNDMKKTLTQKVTRDTRSQVIDKTLSNKLRLKYGVEENDALISYFKENFEVENKDALDDDRLNSIAFAIEDKKYFYKDVNAYLQMKASIHLKKYGSKAAFIDTEVNKYIDERVKSYHLKNLEMVDPEFNALLKEYKEGLLLFDLLETKIWKVASADTLGLQTFYNKNVKRYDHKSLEEIRGRVMSDYQKSIETSFTDELRNKASVVINKSVLKEVSKQYKDE